MSGERGMRAVALSLCCLQQPPRPGSPAWACKARSADRLLSPPLSSPSRWGLWFSFLLLSTVLVLALRHSLQRHRLTIMAFLVMSSVVLMQNISSYLYEVSKGPDTG
jgi:hypothetical protein